MGRDVGKSMWRKKSKFSEGKLTFINNFIKAKLEGENAPNVEGFSQAMVEISKLQQHISDLV